MASKRKTTVVERPFWYLTYSSHGRSLPTIETYDSFARAEEEANAMKRVTGGGVFAVEVSGPHYHKVKEVRP